MRQIQCLYKTLPSWKHAIVIELSYTQPYYIDGQLLGGGKVSWKSKLLWPEVDDKK